MTGLFRRAMRREEGQALVLACLMVFVLSVAVLTTVNVGYAVHERPRIQNTADAAAYSMAAMEARAFNFYAFANRAQVSHYVSAMVWQSLDSFLYFAEAFLADMYGFLRTIDVCGGKRSVFWKVACPVLERLPMVGPLVSGLDTILGLFRGLVQAYEDLLRSVNPDALIGKEVVPAHGVLNEILAGASTSLMTSVLADVEGTAAAVVSANDPNIDLKRNHLDLGKLSACLFDRAHFKEANGTPWAPVDPSQPLTPKANKNVYKVARAKRVMGALANATRYACDSPGGRSGCPAGFVTSRSRADVLGLPSWAGALESIVDALPVNRAGVLEAGKVGQTRLLSTNYANGQGPKRHENYIRDWRDPPGYGIGELAAADNIGSDDAYWFKVGPPGFGPFANPFACKDTERDETRCWGDPHRDEHHPGDGTFDTPFRYVMKTSIWALNDAENMPGGLHWRVDYARCTGSECDVGVTRTRVHVGGPRGPSVDVYAANVRGVPDRNHAWKGTVPFPHFEPGQFQRECPSQSVASATQAATVAEEFNQPSTWVALHKSSDEMVNPLHDDSGAGTNRPGLLNRTGGVSVALAREGLVLDDSRVPFAGLNADSGLNAIARGQVYYHRPGNWSEQPNFFNPYWRPRLAAVEQGRSATRLVLQLTDLFPRIPPQQVLTH